MLFFQFLNHFNNVLIGPMAGSQCNALEKINYKVFWVATDYNFYIAWYIRFLKSHFCS